MTNLATASNAVPQRAAARINLAQLPGARQLLLLVGIAAAVAVGVAIVLWSRSPSYALLYANLDEKDAAQVVQALQAAGEPYQLGGSGGSVFVPSADVTSLRLKLAAQGLPRGSAESAAAAADSPFGMSDFAEKARYQQGLENDLANTIASLQSVKSARVHLALPKASAFIRDRRPASASVVVTLYPGRRLDPSQVGAIVHLVASSVPDLDPRQVSVIDQQGQLLTAGDGGSAADVADARFRLMQSVEDAYAARVEELLTPLVGAGRVRAQVVADMDFTETEKTSETFDHDKPALRSEQVSSEQRRDGGGEAQGIPGALSNQPPSTPAQPTAANPAAGAAAQPAAAATQAAAAPTESSSAATRNYELDRTISHTRAPVGAIRRLSVAVVVDNKQAVDAQGASKSVPIGKAELAQMTELVKNAVGFDAARGDSVSVVNVPFHTEPAADVPGTPLLSRPGVRDVIKQGLGALVLLVLMFGVLRPLFRSLVGPAAPRRAAPAPALPAAEPAPDRLTLGAAPAAAQAPLDYDQKVTLAKRMVSQDPKQVAQVVKSWVAEDGG
ncbi:flagellar M-ring protein [Mizugakiibacter sediminis]|uniref:Flagellar M-ring protein n=1 Tax=Mizugakiibacter sediminis TaxID=1475481 RepID=A0A0K8QJZ4_9GAMM|nr:flagellar basal-body MS-ring/collar protein FliF [Mizugakiibacter sediminis]GAP65260.1 flagellar M-ring protein [Mizugakiibacter sediminis]